LLILKSAGLLAIIKDRDIPRSTVARLANLHAMEVGAWLPFSQEKIERISQVVADIEEVVRTLPMKADLRDCENAKRLIVAVNDAERQMNLHYKSSLDVSDLRTKAGAAD
jgi:hypothetical protein